jgi:hypothetical protein
VRGRTLWWPRFVALLMLLAALPAASGATGLLSEAVPGAPSSPAAPTPGADRAADGCIPGDSTCNSIVDSRDSGVGRSAARQVPSPTPAVRAVTRQENQRPATTRWQSRVLSTLATQRQTHGPRTHLEELLPPGRRFPTPQLPTRAPQAFAATTPPDAIYAYADQPSVNRGDPIRLYVTTTRPTYDLEVYRMGWYGGAGGRLLLSVPGLPGQNQPIPTPDPDTGLIAANWQAS